MNLHVRSGSGATDDTGTPTGLGNLIVGYNEPPADLTLEEGDRGGAHNMIIGAEHRYSSTGGLVAGVRNTVRGLSASVSGGRFNTASGSSASVSGGESNVASGNRASVSGGSANTASGDRASVSGGASRTADGQFDWRAGGLFEEE